MAAFVLDTSALVVLLSGEPEADAFKHYLDMNETALISAATVFEANCVAGNVRFARGTERLQQMLTLIAPDIVPFDAEQLTVASEAYRRFGRGSGHKAQLNMGDCFSYALARTRNLPLLFKGDDFGHTDVELAIDSIAP